jgi:hypothetical protein
LASRAPFWAKPLPSPSPSSPILRAFYVQNPDTITLLIYRMVKLEGRCP